MTDARLRIAAMGLALAAAVTGQGPLTVAEATKFEATSRHADVMAFITELTRSSEKIRVETMARTSEGKDVPLLVLGDPVPSSPEDLRGDDRAVVYFQANIHAGEVEGKEAAQMLARDILRGATRDYLDRLVILIAPNFNPDGNDKIDVANRPNQHGPVRGVGVRHNGVHLDLNRDGMKLESPEVRGLVKNVLGRWDPVFFLDSHTHNGSYHREPVTWTWGLNPNGDRQLIDYMARDVLPAVTRRMTDDHGTMTIPHGDFVDPGDPAKGWVPLGPQPRYLSNYVGLRNRLSVLNEQYPYVGFEERVMGAYHLFIAFLDFLHERRDEVVALTRDADRRTVERGREVGSANLFATAFGREAVDAKLTIHGWEMERVEDGRGRRRWRPTDKEASWSGVPYLARYTAARSVRRPRGYLVAVPDARVEDLLLNHGVVVERLVEPATLTVEQFGVTSVSPSRRLNQGHYTSSVEGEYSTVERAFPAGTLWVPSAQPLGHVVASLLEPESDDGMVVWNFFDRYLAAQWGRAPQTYPVYKVFAPANLRSEPLSGR